MAPDGDDLAKIQLIVVDLGDEDGCHSFVEGGAIHVDGSAHGEHKAGNAPVDVVVFQQALEGDGQSGRAVGREEASSPAPWPPRSSLLPGIAKLYRLYSL